MPRRLEQKVCVSFDAKDVPTLAEFRTDVVELRLGNAELTQGKADFVDAVTEFLECSPAGNRSADP